MAQHPEPMGSADDLPEGPDPRQIRVLKIVVISLGILLLVGFGVVIGRIAYLALQPGRGQATSAASFTIPARNRSMPSAVGLTW